MTGDRADPPPGDAASCSALGACLLRGARRLDTTHPQAAAALARLGSAIQRYAVGLRSAHVLERYDDPSGPTGASAATAAAATASDAAAIRRLAPARRGRAEAALQRAAHEACREFGDISSGSPGR